MENYQWFEIPKVPLPLFLVILCFIFLGILIGGIGDLYRRFQLKRTLRQNLKKIESLEREIQSLRGQGLDQPSFLKKEG
jgi:H+/Cl- antiporter ClcA